jgi:plasmid stabilization system protein ParE
MSAFEVEFARNAVVDFDETVDWYEARSMDAARRWIEGVERALSELELAPERFPAARESAKLGLPLRECAFGAGRRLTHRMLFTIRPGKVVVYAIHHVSRQDLTFDDLIS